MDEQKNVLLITNSTTESEITLIKQALIHAKEQGLSIKLNLVHVIPNLPTCYFNIPSMVLLAEKYYEEAKKTLTTIGETLNIYKKDQWLITGKMKTEVLRLATKLNTHFILASSGNIQDLHNALGLNRNYVATSIRNINNIVKA